MKKIKKINNNKVLTIVRESLERDGVFVDDVKIDSVIKKYLSEREEILLDDESHLEDGYSFSDESKEAFGDMIGGLEDTIEDLNIIVLKEDDVLVDMDLYSEEYINDIISDLESVVERLNYLKGLE
jgi:hypothetical protein